MIEKLEINEIKKTFLWEWKNFEIKTWKLATQSDWSIVVTLWETSLLVTAVMNENPDEDKDFLPLTIDCRESFYAWWKIWWALYIRREWRPSEQTILNARLTDRPLRPMFPEWMINDIVITITPLSVDKENWLGIPSIIWASLALNLAWIPFEWPVWAVRIWYKDWQYIINPTYEQIETWLLELTLAWSIDTITMVECWANEVPTEILMEAFKLWQKEIERICNFQKEFLNEFNITKKEIKINKPSEEVINEIKKSIPEKYLHELIPSSKKEFNNKSNEIETLVLENFSEEINDWNNKDFTKTKVKMAIFKIIKEYVRENILKNDKRVDWRKLDQVRPLYCEVWLNNRIHWIWLFQRWETQVFSATTLWSPWDVLVVDDMESDWIEKRFMHHYNMPWFSTNEAKAWRWASRREIWHWKLAEKALTPVIPNEDIFPYTIRVVSEVFSCNWSTSMASVCATTLSLMDAWVPISSPISWIAMWLVTDWENYKVLTDIQWVEDFTWDMDFKIAWSKKWITALQMDMKIKWLKFEVIEEAINKWNKAREDILNFMLETIEKPNENLSIYAPKITTMKLEPSQVREVIWSWWSNINEITRITWVKIDFKDDWTTTITAKNSEAELKAIEMIRASIWKPEIWQITEWTITRVEQYWIFVDIWKKKVWLCHVKNLWKWFISDPKVMYKEGQKIRVKIIWLNENDWKIELRKEE